MKNSAVENRNLSMHSKRQKWVQLCRVLEDYHLTNQNESMWALESGIYKFKLYNKTIIYSGIYII